MITLYIVRHGQCESGPPGFIQGQSDSPLTELGRRQAEAIADRLSTGSFAAIYSSDLSRARDTALAIASRHGLPVIETPLVRECCLGAAQGLTTAEFEKRHPEEYRLWQRDSINNRPPGAERFEEVIARCGEFLQALREKHVDGDTVVMVGHIGSVNGTICAAFDLPVRFYLGMRPQNTGLSVLDIGEKPVLHAFNDTGHLDALELRLSS